MSAGPDDAIHEEEALGKAVDVALLLRLWRYIAPYKHLVFTTILLAVPLFLVELAPADTGAVDTVVPLPWRRATSPSAAS